MEYVYLQPEDKIVIGAKTNYAKLFGNDWCPLFSSIHLAGIVDERSSAMISESIIFDAREILGIKPCQLPLTEAEIKLFESSGRLKDTPKYPQWKIDIAQNILRIHPRVKNEADIVGFEEDGHPIRTNEPLDEIWEAAVGIVKKSIAPRLNEEIKDYHILSILAIAEAWDALKNFLYGKEKENNSDIMRQLQVAGKLLSKAKELSLEEKNKLLKQDAENVKNNMYKMMANQEGVYGQINKTKKAVEPILYQKTPKDAKWQDLTMAFPNHIEDKVDICFKGKQKETVFLKDLGFVDKKATKIFKPLESLVLLKRFAEAKNNDILSADSDKERKKMHVQVESLRSILKLCFCIEGDPVPAIEGGGYRLLFRASCYDIEEKQEVDTYLENLNDHFRDLKTEASNTGNYRDSTRIDELVKLIRAVTKEIIKRARKIQIKNAVCTECYQKIPLCTLDEGNIQILCDTCTPEPTNEYKSQSLIDYKDNDIPRTD